MSPVMETLTGIMIAVLIFYSAILISKNELDINNFFSFLAAMMLAYQPVRALSTLNMIYNQGLASASRILPIIDQKNKIQELEFAKPINITDAEIKFKNLNFSYEIENKKTLKSLNLEFLGGKMTSLVGHSGSGKSTILNLIPRFYDAQSGDIMIDNQSIYKATISSLRKNISLVSQETTLFDDTIMNNIRYAKEDATVEEVYEASRLSYCDEFINSLPNKYETLIGENGVRLSGGEKQRLSIARAMMKKGSIVLLDEATSSLDSETESKIQEALNILTKNKTTIVIAHRLSTILSSNNIFVIDNGEVVDSGTHKDLLEKSDLYKNFYEKQIQK
jgi:subfamily B ATP-binding cassette protein MsbA